jgi:hypothetical protein
LTPEPPERHGAVLGNLLALPGVYGNLVPDAHLAALAIEWASITSAIGIGVSPLKRKAD